MNKHINIIAFNIPWPANYGGVIDVYYKMKALYDRGVRIILHCFEYERPHAPELEAICEKIYYYKRRTGLISNLTPLPYNVYSRKDPKLLANLLANDYPILFEGLHSCYYLNDPRLQNRRKIFRSANIEHDYYRHLACAEDNIVKKLFFMIESMRFKCYQKVLNHADLMLAVSTTDRDYLKKNFPEKEVEFMPCFHGNNQITALPGQSDFILYHGKLSVVENEQAVLFLIRNVFSKLSNTCIIAGMNPSRKLLSAASVYSNIRIEANPSEERINFLIREAQIHLLITFQGTGLKLKLLNSLFAGRHIVVNHLMTTGSGLEPLCHTAETAGEMVKACRTLMNTPFEAEQIEQRKRLLFPQYSNKEQSARLCLMIYNET